MDRITTLLQIVCLLGGVLSSPVPCSQHVNCELPDCFCPSKRAPNDLEREQVPQMVMFSFNDAIHDQVLPYYMDLFPTDRMNANGCPASATFFVSHNWTDYRIVQDLYLAGHEIAVHSISHRTPPEYWIYATYDTMKQEMGGQRKHIVQEARLPQEDVAGLRMPFIEMAGDTQIEFMQDSGFLYDATMMTGPHHDGGLFPFTMDFPPTFPYACSNYNCPKGMFPGVWEIPLNRWYDNNGQPCAMTDTCQNPLRNKQEVLSYLWRNFYRHYNGNRAPLGVNLMASWFGKQHHFDALMEFIQMLTILEDVYLVSGKQVIEWMKNPTAIEDIKNFQPWQTSCENRKLLPETEGLEDIEEVEEMLAAERLVEAAANTVSNTDAKMGSERKITQESTKTANQDADDSDQNAESEVDHSSEPEQDSVPDQDSKKSPDPESEQESEQELDQSADQALDQASDQAPDETANNGSDESSDLDSDKDIDQRSEQDTDQVSDQGTSQGLDKESDKVSEQTSDQTEDQNSDSSQPSNTDSDQTKNSEPIQTEDLDSDQESVKYSENINPQQTLDEQENADNPISVEDVDTNAEEAKIIQSDKEENDQSNSEQGKDNGSEKKNKSTDQPEVDNEDSDRVNQADKSSVIIAEAKDLGSESGSDTQTIPSQDLIEEEMKRLNKDLLSVVDDEINAELEPKLNVQTQIEEQEPVIDSGLDMGENIHIETQVNQNAEADKPNKDTPNVNENSDDSEQSVKSNDAKELPVENEDSQETVETKSEDKVPLPEGEENREQSKDPESKTEDINLKEIYSLKSVDPNTPDAEPAPEKKGESDNAEEADVIAETVEKSVGNMYHYGKIEDVEEVVNEEGEAIIQLNLSKDQEDKYRAKHGKSLPKSLRIVINLEDDTIVTQSESS